jgi:spermidine synthase
LAGFCKGQLILVEKPLRGFENTQFTPERTITPEDTLKRPTLALVPITALLAFGLLVAAGTRVIYEKDSAYNHIIVTEDDRGIRKLLFEDYGATQSAVKVGDPDHLELPYARVVPVCLATIAEPKRTLIIGVGGGTIPGFLHKHYPKMRIDAVDIDPDVIDVAKLFFGLKEDDTLKTHAADGRKFIEETKDPYDIIVLDAYGADSIPYSLATKEFLEGVRKALTPKGVVAANLWSRASNPLFDSMLKTYQEVFDQVYLFDVENSSNKIVLAIPRKGKQTKEELSKKGKELSKKEGFRNDLGPIIDYGYQYATEMLFDGKVLTDSK